MKGGQFAVIASVFVMSLLLLSSLSVMFAPAPTKARTAANDAWIVGYVTDGLNPIQDAFMLYVLSMGGGGGPLGMAITNATGYYNLTVSGGVGYQVIGMNGSYYAAAGGASPLPGQEFWLNFTMNSIAPLVADVVLTGYVLDGLGNPVPGGGVLGFVNDPANGGEGMPLYGNVTYPDPSTGRYTVNVIPGSAGGGIGGMGFVGYGFTDNSTKDPFESGHTYWINLTLSNPPSTDDAIISGSVTDASTGDPISNAAVSIEVQNQWMGKSYMNMTFTDSAGDYEMNVTNGSARLTFQAAHYSIYMTNNNFQIDHGSHVIMDAMLLATNATISGNVTEAGTGIPLAGVQVIITDGENHYAAATTNASGGYEMEVFIAPSEQIWTQFSGYAASRYYVTIQPGEHQWIDFQISPLNAWLTGKVTDAILGTPVADVEVRVHTVTGDATGKTNSSGDYNITLESGNCSIEANANNYEQYNYGPLQIEPGANTFDIALMPFNLPQTTRLYGWINDSVSGTGIPNANVRVGLAPPYSGQMMTNSTNGTGYYEVWVPPVPLQFVATATDHTHAEAQVNATGQMVVRVDASLVPDLQSPNVTMLLYPTENISAANPSSINVTVQESDLQQMNLVFFMHVNSSFGTSDYMMVQAFTQNFDPLSQGMSGLPYSHTGDEYNVSMMWYASGTGGLLTSGPIRQYFGAFMMPMGPDVYLGLRAMYYNTTLGSSQEGMAWFDNVTGEFVFFSFNGPKQFADSSDPTGMITPLASVLRVNDTNNMTMWYDSLGMGNWSVVGLHLFKNGELPSGRYISVFSASDFGGRGNGIMMYVTVDNDPPVADAGPDQSVAPGETVHFDGTGSTDNVGITNYTWSFDNGATPVVLWGPNPDFTFLGEGVYNVTLEVRDGANHISIDIVQITVTAAIPEFTSAVIPVFGMVLIVAVTWARRSKRSE